MKSFTLAVLCLSIVLCTVLLGRQAIDIIKVYQLAETRQIETLMNKRRIEQ